MSKMASDMLFMFASHNSGILAQGKVASGCMASPFPDRFAKEKLCCSFCSLKEKGKG
jgi:hypothetical protein